MAAVALLAACGPSKLQLEAPAAQQTRDAATASCERSYPDKHRKPVTPRVKCFNEARLDYAQAHERSVGNPALDLEQLVSAQMLAIAERYDAGKLTVAQYEAEKAAAIANYSSAVLQRRQGAAMVRAAQDEAAAARQQAAAAAQQAINSSMPTTCSRVGNTVTCY
jgi:hypothetical protein